MTTISQTSETDPAIGKREQNRARTRAALEDAALRLFARNGYDAVAVDEIAEAAGVSPRTFFRYFASKDDVLQTDTGRLRLLLDALADRPAEESPFEAIREAFASLGSAYQHDRERVLLRIRAIATTPNLRGRAAQVEEAWQKGIAATLARREGARTPSARHHTIAASAMTMLRLAADRWLASRGRAHFPSVIAEQFDLLIGALDGKPATRRPRRSRR
jgi:AcrR family transcriptional regulator